MISGVRTKQSDRRQNLNIITYKFTLHYVCKIFLTVVLFDLCPLLLTDEKLLYRYTSHVYSPADDKLKL